MFLIVLLCVLIQILLLINRKDGRGFKKNGRINKRKPFRKFDANESQNNTNEDKTNDKAPKSHNKKPTLLELVSLIMRLSNKDRSRLQDAFFS